MGSNTQPTHTHTRRSRGVLEHARRNRPSLVTRGQKSKTTPTPTTTAQSADSSYRASDFFKQQLVYRQTRAGNSTFIYYCYCNRGRSERRLGAPAVVHANRLSQLVKKRGKKKKKKNNTFLCLSLVPTPVSCPVSVGFSSRHCQRRRLTAEQSDARQHYTLSLSLSLCCPTSNHDDGRQSSKRV